MSPTASISSLATQITRMNRTQCIGELLRYKKLKLDFTRSYLEQMSLEKLQHTLFAAACTAKRKRAG